MGGRRELVEEGCVVAGRAAQLKNSRYPGPGEKKKKKLSRAVVLPAAGYGTLR